MESGEPKTSGRCTHKARKAKRPTIGDNDALIKKLEGIRERRKREREENG